MPNHVSVCLSCRRYGGLHNRPMQTKPDMCCGKGFLRELRIEQLYRPTFMYLAVHSACSSARRFDHVSFDITLLRNGFEICHRWWLPKHLLYFVLSGPTDHRVGRVNILFRAHTATAPRQTRLCFHPTSSAAFGGSASRRSPECLRITLYQHAQWASHRCRRSRSWSPVKATPTCR